MSVEIAERKMTNPGNAAIGGKPRLLALDALRGLCAVFVALLHAKAISHFNDSAFVQGSWLFVDFFFVLSGFVIAYVYLDRIESGISFAIFCIRRFGRLWPVHAFILLLYIVSEAVKAGMSHTAGFAVHTLPFSGATSADTIISHLFMVHALGLYDRTGWNAPSWSISAEFYTYLVFAALCIGARRWIAVTATIMICASVFILLAFTSQYLGTPLEFSVFRCFYGFFCGVLTLFGYRAIAARRWRLPVASLMETGCIVLTVAFVVFGARGGAVTMFAPLVFAAVILIFSFEAGWLSRLLCTPAFTWLGDRSYAVYMIHAFLNDMIIRVLLLAGTAAFIPTTLVEQVSTHGEMMAVMSFGNRFITDLAVLLYLLAVLVSAHILHIIVERPGRTLFNRAASTYRAYVRNRTGQPAEGGFEAINR